MRKPDARVWFVALLPVAAALWVWFSSLSFVPVPWPDDSAFYFVGRDFFKWPPRWVMIPQAPFEPTYRIFNFNTMPLYPIIVGLGRLAGVDGSWAIKFWPLAAWAASGALLARALVRSQSRGVRMPLVLAISLVLPMALDPALRWASVLVRPESLIGLCALALVLGLTLGFPRRLRPRGLWDPAAALLAIGAYAHFNAVHLVFPVVLAFLRRPRRIFDVGWRTAFYLWPWALTVAAHPHLFWHQMGTQWTRLQVHNSWLDSANNAVNSLYPDMGSPEPWPHVIRFASVGIWLWILAAGVFGLLLPLYVWAMRQWDQKRSHLVMQETSPLSLLPAGGWVLGSLWLWHTKPEVWFVYYIHLAIFTFLALAGLKSWKSYQSRGFIFLPPIWLFSLFFSAIFLWVDIRQETSLAAQSSWHWNTYYSFVDCIDGQLVETERRLGSPKPFRVWDPTFPDVTIELSRRHPDWEFTRTNDFWERAHLAIRHGYDVEAVVVPETVGYAERFVSTPMKDRPDIESIWMTWKGYFLHYLNDDPQFKPDHRYICQRGRWAAFIYAK